MANVSFTYDYSFLIKTLKYILLPVVAIVTIVGFFVFIYSRRAKKDNIERYNYIIDLWTTLIAIFVVGVLFAITLGFSLSLTSTIKSLNLVEGHEFIYYLVLITPVVPLIFLFIYIYKFILTLANKPKEDKNSDIVEEKEINNIEETEEEKEYTDYHIDFTNFNDNYDKKESIIEEENNVVETLKSDDNSNNGNNDNNDNNEEVLDLTDFSEDEEIEIL